MKKFSRILLSGLLIIALLASSAVFAIPASAQVMTKLIASFDGLSAATATMTEDYIKVDTSGVIQDSLQLKLSNADAEKNIQIVDITTNYTNVKPTLPDGVLDVSSIVIVPGESISMDLKGTAANGGVLTVTVTYQLEGYPTSTRETVKVSKYCAYQAAYQENEQFVFIDGRIATSHLYGACTYMKYYPFSSSSLGSWTSGTFDMPIADDEGSYTQHETKYKIDSGEEYNDTSRANNLAFISGDLWVDSSKYPDFSDLGAYIGHHAYSANGHTRRKFTLMEVVYGKLSNLEANSIASLSVGDISLDATTKEDWAFTSLSSDQNNDYGVATTSISGKIGSESQYTVWLRMIGRGTESWVSAFGYGVGSKQSELIGAEYTITVHNNNKGSLRSRINVLETMALNEASYTASSWSAYQTALTTAYKVLGANSTYKNGSSTVTVTKAVVASTLDALNTAYNGLVRNVTVETNHFLRDKQVKIAADGTVTTEIVTISRLGDYADYNLTAVDGSTYTFNVLNDSDVDPKHNHSDVTRSAVLNGAENDYKVTVDQYYWYVDDSALQAKVDKYDHLMNLDKEDYLLDGVNVQKIVGWNLRGDITLDNGVPVDRKGNQIYTTDSWENYQAEMIAAKQLLADTSNCYQYDVDVAVNAVTKAENDLTNADIDNLDYIDGRAWAECILYDSYYTDPGYGWNKDEFFLGSALDKFEALEDINSKIDALESGDPFVFTAADAEDWASTLWAAINDLYIVDETTSGAKVEFGNHFADVSRYGYYNTLADQDYTEYGLKDLFLDIIDDPSAEYDNIQLDESLFTEDSWAALEDALYGNYEPGLGGVAETQEFYETNDDIGEINVPAYSMINNIWYLASQANYNACFDFVMDKVNNLEYINDTAPIEEAVATASEAADLITGGENPYTDASTNAFLGIFEEAAAMAEALAEPQTYGMGADAIRQDAINSMADSLLAACAQLDLKPAMTISDSKLSIDENGAVEGISAGTTVDSLLAKLDIDKADVEIGEYKGEYHIETASGITVDNNSAVGTGYKIVLTYNGVVYDEHVIIVTGDVNGDAQKTTADYRTIYNFAFYNIGLNVSSINYVAADINGDGIVNLCDAALLKRSMN